jgi:long-chain acyl-CoA synthetase
MGLETPPPNAATAELVSPDAPWVKSYSPGVKWDRSFPPRAVHELLDLSAARGPNQPYLDFLGRGYSYGEIARLVNRAAAGFQKLGVKKGVRVGLFLPNCPQYVIAYYGALKAGGTIVNYSPLYSVPELLHQVEDSQTDFMVCLDVAQLYGTIAQVLEQSRLKALIVGSLAQALPPGKALLYRMFKRREIARVTRDHRHIAFDQLLDNAGDYTTVDIEPQTDIAVLQYTGGTTGAPKGAVLTHANLATNAQQVASYDPDIGFGKDRMLGALPFFHVFANTVVLNLTTWMGGEVVMLPKFELAQALAAIQRKKITVVPGVPTMYTAMLNYPKLGKFDLSSIRACISGGAPLPVELKKRFEALTGGRVLEGYGLTESSGVVSVNPFKGENRAGSIGLPIPGTEIIILDKADPTRSLPQGETGELGIRGPQVMQGYWNKPADTADVLVRVDAGAPVLRTGDVGYTDADGYTFIIDRLKDMIMVGGFKVFPRHVEEALYSHPAVKEATVIGIEDAYLGQRPKAFVVLQEGAAATPEELLGYLKTRLGKHEQPAALEIRESLPKTMIGKLSKKELVAEEAAKAQG